MTAATLPEIQHLFEFGVRHALSGDAKPDYASWSATYGAGETSVQAHRAFCRGFDQVREAAWEKARSEVVQRRVSVSLPRRRRIAVPA
jgi:hypothetical protein